jgi:hypothetical protein
MFAFNRSLRWSYERHPATFTHERNIANLVEFVSSPTKLNIYFCHENTTFQLCANGFLN